ncbi:MAG: hypothetical protein GXO50_08370, partial [Chlorobi bacterium]|nr:hypothetical protein [Chlorobiota bacterium]
MLKLFKSTNPLIAILYPLTAAVFVIFLPGTTSEQSEINGYPFLYKLLIKLISGNFFSFTYGFLSILFFTADGIFYNYIIRKLRIVKSYRNLHGFIFMFLTGSILRFTSPLQTLAAIFFFLL